ncbi:MAG: 3-methyl-2-oxobutanoate hydroxymethyltransferase [Candidatus Gastranaerophilaceae bacterium]
MIKKNTIKTITKLKNENQKITVLTAYDYSTAKYLDEAGVDIILVGDSLANVALGYNSTQEISMEEMLIFTAAVARGTNRALVVGDMPFMSFNVSIESALENIGRMIKAGASAVKIEGCNDYILSLIKRCTESGIPVMAHLGFTPQYIHTLGGYRIQGKTQSQTDIILEAAKRLQDAGAFSLVLEMVPEENAKYITENLDIPTIGIGAGRYCSGQVLVSDDLLGKFSDYVPSFVRKYANLKEIIKNAAESYCNDVRNGNFPDDNEVFKLEKEEAKC